jgi:hypothetical protein
MIDGHHYRVDFVTFCRILGFGHVHRTYSRIHDARRAEPREVSFMWQDQDLSRPDWSRTKLKSLYYIMNNLIRCTLNPKDNATDLNGYITNVLSRFPDGERFNVARFIWVELAYAMDDGRRGLPYAPYLMFMIERVTGMRFLKDCVHMVYRIKKTRGSRFEDRPESSRGHRRSRSGGRIKKFGQWIKAIFATCTYTATTV